MAAHETVLVQRTCLRAECVATFFLCSHCDRGHRYSSQACSQRARQEQRRRANQRHQRSPEGRLDHRDRQRDYRQRCEQRTPVTECCLNGPPVTERCFDDPPVTPHCLDDPPVTDHSSVSITSPALLTCRSEEH